MRTRPSGKTPRSGVKQGAPQERLTASNWSPLTRIAKSVMERAPKPLPMQARFGVNDGLKPARKIIGGIL